jgi:hypothetical protein
MQTQMRWTGLGEEAVRSEHGDYSHVWQHGDNHGSDHRESTTKKGKTAYLESWVGFSEEDNECRGAPMIQHWKGEDVGVKWK